MTSPLLSELPLGDLRLPNRVLMAPLTRSRSEAPANTQTPLHALYYAQRASAGLIISEATQISQEGQGYAWTPGIHSEAQEESWRVVTDAVHDAGGRIFCQLWHVGAISHEVLQPGGGAPVSASAWQPKGKAFVGDFHEDGPFVPHPEARELGAEEIGRVVEDYRQAAKKAASAGFDGVEIHAANGYLIDQFLRSSVNRRTDAYGGSLEGRLRFLGEVADAVASELPASRIGVRLSPAGGPGGSYDENPKETYVEAARLLSGRGLAYLHVIRPNDYTAPDAEENLGEALLDRMREAFGGTFLANGGFTKEEAESWVREGRADGVTFGRAFLANPDLPERFLKDAPLNEADKASYYGGGWKGYTDYPSLRRTGDGLRG
jgi:N-ethylmaleimide reductase